MPLLSLVCPFFSQVNTPEWLRSSTLLALTRFGLYLLGKRKHDTVLGGSRDENSEVICVCFFFIFFLLATDTLNECY